MPRLQGSDRRLWLGDRHDPTASNSFAWVGSGEPKVEVPMLGWVGDIERATLENETFRTVLHTGEHVQLTVMRLGPGEDIGRETHPHLDQFLRIESGSGRVEFGRSEDAVDETHEVRDDWAIIVPAGVWHNVVNTGDGELKLYSLYAPPEHPDGTVHRTKADAMAAEHD
ncbi:MAG TPA: cupin domain-containing protein [Actinomycetota bacterium]|nr:cupin domain-containing protein [Actinomycetota bacterium]